MKTMRNSVSLVGHLGSDIQFLTLSTGRKVARMSLATNEFYTSSSGQRQAHTEWHRLTAWGPLAEQFERLEIGKGAHLMVEGRLVYRIFSGREGEKRSVSEIVLTGFLSPGRERVEAA